jgi:hypothetical protein
MREPANLWRGHDLISRPAEYHIPSPPGEQTQGSGLLFSVLAVDPFVRSSERQAKTKRIPDPS